MYWILVLQILVSPCQGTACEVAQPASAPFASKEVCEQSRTFMRSWGGDDTTVTLGDAGSLDTTPQVTLRLRWNCVPASLAPPAALSR